MDQKIYLMLGRIGDIINILPAIEYEAKTNNYKPILVVAKNYANLLDGCNYVKTLVYDGNFKDHFGAINYVKKKYPSREIIACTVCGDGYHFERECRNYNRESWKFSQCSVAWGKLPLNFDNRSAGREKDLLNNLSIKKDDKPIIITALSGISSPFAYSQQLSKYLNENLKDFRLIDISDFKAKRYYDLIKLFEVAHSLITIDSAALHLSHAVPKLPVVSLIVDHSIPWLQSLDKKESDYWYRSGWRSNHVLRLLYSEASYNFPLITRAAREGFNFKRHKIYFVTSSAKNLKGDCYRRTQFALKTRLAEARYAGNIWEFHNYDDPERDATKVGDVHKMPFVKDMIEYIANKAKRDKDILMICNSDICFLPGITEAVLDVIYRYGAAYFHRWDERKGTIDKPLLNMTGLNGYIWYDGSDTFAFTKEWWIKNKDTFPDMIFGREYWDCIFRNLIKRSGGIEIHKAIYHDKHPGFWEKNKRQNAGNNYNTKLALEWFNTYGGDTFDWKFKVEEWPSKYKY